MCIINILFKALSFRLNFPVFVAGIIALLFCSTSWAYVGDFRIQTTPAAFSKQAEDLLLKYFLLTKKSKKWQDLSPKEKEKIRKKYKEWQSLPADEKKIMRRRMDQLNKMSPRERKLYEELFRKWQTLPPKKRKQLQKDLERWEHLSPRQQNAIRQRFLK